MHKERCQGAARYGLAGGPLSNLIIENNDLSFNNTAHLDPGDAGGSKIIGGSQTGSYFVTWRNNHVHDNYGQGIWSDGNVHNALYEPFPLVTVGL